MRKNPVEEKIDKSVDINFDYLEISDKIDFSAYFKPAPEKAPKRRVGTFLRIFIPIAAAVTITLFILPLGISAFNLMKSITTDLSKNGATANYEEKNSHSGEPTFIRGNELAPSPEEAADAAKADDGSDYGSFVLLNDNPTFFSKDDGGYYDISPDAEYLDADGNAISAEDFSAGERVEASLLSEDSDGTELVVKIKKMK